MALALAPAPPPPGEALPTKESLGWGVEVGGPSEGVKMEDTVGVPVAPPRKRDGEALPPVCVVVADTVGVPPPPPPPPPPTPATAGAAREADGEGLTAPLPLVSRD